MITRRGTNPNTVKAAGKSDVTQVDGAQAVRVWLVKRPATKEQPKRLDTMEQTLPHRVINTRLNFRV